MCLKSFKNINTIPQIWKIRKISTTFRYANLTSCRCILKIQANIYNSGSLTYANFSISVILPMRGPQQTSNNMILWSNFTPFEASFTSFAYFVSLSLLSKAKIRAITIVILSQRVILKLCYLSILPSDPPTSHASMQILKQWGYQKKLILFFAFNSYLSPFFSWKSNAIVLFKIFH